MLSAPESIPASTVATFAALFTPVGPGTVSVPATNGHSPSRSASTAWEPWNYAASGVAAQRQGLQPKYALRRIVAGNFDAYLLDWAREIRQFRDPVAIRFAHEMNGNWYPWDDGVNGNRPGDYVAAWRHVHDLFEAAGATNVIWVWSPNKIFEGSLPLRGLYPGDRYVDWVGVVGYYGRPIRGRGYPTFDELFGPTLREIHTITDEPVVLTETGGTEVGGHKADFIQAFFTGLRRHPEVIGFNWFEVNKETDWRVVSSPAARPAFAAAVADRRYGALSAPTTRQCGCTIRALSSGTSRSRTVSQRLLDPGRAPIRVGDSPS